LKLYLGVREGTERDSLSIMSVLGLSFTTRLRKEREDSNYDLSVVLKKKTECHCPR